MKASSSAKLFHGYYILAACFFVLFMLWGMVLNAFPVFVGPITEDMGWKRGALAVASLVGSIGSILVSPVVGRIVDRSGVRAVMAVGALLIGTGLLGGSLVTKIWQLYAAFALIGVGLASATIIPCSTIVSNWFVSRRGTAMAAAFVGTAVGGMVMAPVSGWIIRRFSWRVAFAAAGCEILFLVIPVIFFVIRTRPSDVGLEPYRDSTAESCANGETRGAEVSEALSMSAFWLIAAVILIVGIVTSGVGYHCVVYLTDLGHLQSKATYAWSLAMGIMILGKISVGPLADRWGSKNTMAAACMLFAVSIFTLISARPYSLVILFAVLYGFTLGAPLVLNPLLAGDYMGTKNFGAIFGILTVMGTIGGAVGPVAAGFFFDRKGSYLPVFHVFAGLMVLAAACAALIRPTPHLTQGLESDD